MRTSFLGEVESKYSMISNNRETSSKTIGLLEEESGHQLSPTKKNKRRVQFISTEEEHHLTTLRGRVYSLSPASSPRKPTKRPALRSSDVSPHVKRSIKFGETSTSHVTSADGVTSRTDRSARKRKGSSFEGESSKVRVQEVYITKQSLSKWQPLSENTSNMFSDMLLAAFGHSLNGLSKSHKTQAERELNLIISQVREELKSTTAPPTNRMVSYTGLSQQVAVLKDKCLSVVQRNSELEERLTERRSDVDIKQSRSQQLSEITSTNHHDTFPSDENNPQLTSVRTCTEDFSTHLVNLLENGRHKDTHVLFKS